MDNLTVAILIGILILFMIMVIFTMASSASITKAMARL